MKPFQKQPESTAVDASGKTVEERMAACGTTIAIVLAYEPGTEAGVKAVTGALRASRMPGVFVLAGPGNADWLAHELQGVKRKGNAQLVQVLQYDPLAAQAMGDLPDGMEAAGLPFGLLLTARALAETAYDVYDSVAFVEGGDAGVTADDLHDLCAQAKAGEADVVASGEGPARIVVKRPFLEKLGDMPAF